MGQWACAAAHGPNLNECFPGCWLSSLMSGVGLSMRMLLDFMNGDVSINGEVAFSVLCFISGWQFLGGTVNHKQLAWLTLGLLIGDFRSC